MRTNAHLVAGESRWLPVSIAIAAMALTPSAAHASSKLFNAKSPADSKAACAGRRQHAHRQRRWTSLAPFWAARRARSTGSAPTSRRRNAPALWRCFPPASNIKLEPASRTPIGSGAGAESCGAPVALAPLAEPGADYDPAAELGTRAIPVKRTRFDDRWDHVRRAAPAALMHGKLRRANATSGLDEKELLRASISG
jgi:hypothetical protein